MKIIKPIEKLIYLVDTDKGKFVLKFSKRLYEAQFSDILGKDPECNPYIVCMYKWFDISHDQAYKLTNGFIGNIKEPPIVRAYIEGKLTEINLFHPSDKYTGILLEPMDGTVEYLKKAEFFKNNNQEIIKLLIFGLLGLAYIHSKNISHQDIFDANILFKNTSNGMIYKISDFGEACGEPVNKCFDLEFSKKEDVTMFGKTIFEIMTGKYFYEDNDLDDINIFLNKFIIPKEWSNNMRIIFNIVKDMILSNETNAEKLLNIINDNSINIKSI